MGNPVWCCPRCRSALASEASTLRCVGCGHSYDVVCGIPDLRVPADTWIDYEHDRAEAIAIHAEAKHGIEHVVRTVFARREGWAPADIDRRARQVLTMPQRLARELDGWLRPAVSEGDTFLDLGCGPGTLLAAAASLGRNGIGIDVSLAWLVVAREFIASAGGTPMLAAGCAEHLPLADRAVSNVVALDVIEHVADARTVLSEIHRVTRAGGRFALATPNRYSLTAEPHVNVWGVGWLPRPVQARYVHWRSRKRYDHTCLFSTNELRGLLRDAHFSPELIIPEVPPEEIARFSRSKAAVAKLYNRMVDNRTIRSLLTPVCPFFRIVATNDAAVPGSR